MNSICKTMAAAVILSAGLLQAQFNPKYEKKIDSLISKMTLQEKIGQTHQISSGFGFGPVIQTTEFKDQKELIRQGNAGSFLNAVGAETLREFQRVAVEETRMHIPLIFGLDVIHGYKTTFPVPIAEASSWDTAIVRKSARYQAIESSANGIHWTFTPMVDIARDPRWGRIVEGSGEDPYLGSLMAAARVKGYQNDFRDNTSIAACAKHFAAYGAAEGGRDYNTVDISDRTLREIYLVPFKAACDAGAATFMCSFNEINGVPSSANRYLLTDILRGEWGFKGILVSDWNSVGELIPHGIAADPKEAARLALHAGVDIDMESRCYLNTLADQIKNGKVPEAELDEAVRRILRVKFLMGLFDDPYKYFNEERQKKVTLNSDMQAAALDVARKSVVLLKNEKQVLPISDKVKTLAVIGPFANLKYDMLGPWAQQGDSSDVTTVLEGLKKKTNGKINILYAQGCDALKTPENFELNKEKIFSDAVETAKKADAVVLVLGEITHMSGEAKSRASLELPGIQEELAKAVKKAGKPVIAVIVNGRPLSINWLAENADAIVESWFLGIKEGEAMADILYGDYNPSGKLPVTFPKFVGQVPAYYNHKNTGRPYDPANNYTSGYKDFSNDPLYPFGFGLSYTKFEYGKVKLSLDKLTGTSSIKVSVEVKNSGEYDGEEVVQLYIRDIAGSVTRPVKELKNFKKVMIKKGETKNVEFEIAEKDLRFYDKDMKFKSEPGQFKVFVGTNSRDVQEADFELL